MTMTMTITAAEAALTDVRAEAEPSAQPRVALVAALRREGGLNSSSRDPR